MGNAPITIRDKFGHQPNELFKSKILLISLKFLKFLKNLLNLIDLLKSYWWYWLKSFWLLVFSLSSRRASFRSASPASTSARSSSKHSSSWNVFSLSISLAVWSIRKLAPRTLNDSVGWLQILNCVSNHLHSSRRFVVMIKHLTLFERVYSNVTKYYNDGGMATRFRNSLYGRGKN